MPLTNAEVDAAIPVAGEPSRSLTNAALKEIITDIAAKQDGLVSGSNIKTVNGQSLLGSGNLEIAGGEGGATNLDATHSPTGVTVTSDTGTDAALLPADATNAGLMAPAQVTKLAGIAAGATANATDAQLRDRTTHTGEQAISTVTGLQAALDAKVAAAEKGAANGVAPLGADSKIAAAYLPSYVDDVLEYANQASFPGTGETGKLYIAIDTGATFRWSGSAYSNIGSAPAYASQAEAEAGTENTKTMTALRAAQAIAARARDALLTGLSLASSADVAATDSIVAAFGKLQAKWNAFAASVRAVVLTGIDIATTGAVAATDTVLQAIGKLQASKSDAVTAGTTISASRALVAADVGKLFTVDTSAGAVALTLDTGVLSTVKDAIYFRRSGANALTVVSGTATVSNPSGVVCANGDMIALMATAANAGLLVGNVAAGTGDALTSNPLSQFASTTSAQLHGVLSDPTGTGSAVFADSPNLGGTPTGPTAAPGTNTTQLATTAFVQAMRDALLNAAPGALDTLDELAAALGDDANFATTMTNALAAKAPLESPALTGTPTVPTAAPGTDTTQAASTAFVQAAVAAAGGGAVEAGITHEFRFTVQGGSGPSIIAVPNGTVTLVSGSFTAATGLYNNRAIVRGLMTASDAVVNSGVGLLRAQAAAAAMVPGSADTVRFVWEGYFFPCDTGAGRRAAVGAAVNPVVTAATADPDTFANAALFAKRAADDNYQLIVNDGTGNGSVVDLGASFLATGTGGPYFGRIEIRGGATRTVHYSVTNLDTGVEVTNTITTNVPDAGVILGPIDYIANGPTTATAATKLMSTGRVYNYQAAV